MFYGLRNGGERIMAEHLRALAAAQPNFHLFFCFSDPAPADEGLAHAHRGRVDIALLRQQLPLTPWHVYLCGPTPMMESLVGELAAWGVPDERIHFEAFGPASVARPAKDALPAGGENAAVDGEIFVNFARSGRRLAWRSSFANLLELAEANGVAVDSGCRAGACGGCQTAVSAGEVAYRHPPDFDVAPGSCLLCSAVPKTSITLEA